MKRTIIILITAAFLACVGTCVYFVGNVSSTLPSIKEYEYPGNVNQFIDKLKLFTSSDSNMTLKVSEPMGSTSNGYAYDITLTVKERSGNLLYELKLEDIGGIKTKILLIGAHNLTNDTGGYGIKATGMKILLNIFDSKILSTFKKQFFINVTSPKMSQAFCLRKNVLLSVVFSKPLCECLRLRTTMFVACGYIGGSLIA